MDTLCRSFPSATQLPPQQVLERGKDVPEVAWCRPGEDAALEVSWDGGCMCSALQQMNAAFQHRSGSSVTALCASAVQQCLATPPVPARHFTSITALGARRVHRGITCPCPAGSQGRQGLPHQDAPVAVRPADTHHLFWVFILLALQA